MLIGGKAWFILGARGRQSLEYFGDKGRSGLGLRFLTIIGGYPIRGSDSGVGLISSPQIDTGGIKVRLMLGEIILEAREGVMRRKEGVCQEDTCVKGIPFEIGYSLAPVILLQVYYVLTYWTSQGLYLHWESFVQRLLSTGSSSPLKYKF